MTHYARPTHGVEHNPQEVGIRHATWYVALERYLPHIVLHGANLEILPSPQNPLSLMELLSLITPVLGYRQKQATDILGCSLYALKQYEDRARKKLNAKTKTQAFYIALTRGYMRVLTDKQLETRLSSFSRCTESSE